jgi:integrase
MTSLTQEYEQYDPMVSFTYGLKSAESRRQYPRRFKVFLDFLNLKGDLSNQAKEFWLTAKDNPRWAEENLMKFITAQNERADTGEISPSTVPNYYKSTKLFCEMNEISLNWKKIAKGLPRVRDAANDRAPTIQEIQKLVQYPDRRIKPIVFLMASSGIRIGVFDSLQWKHISPIYSQTNRQISTITDN